MLEECTCDSLLIWENFCWWIEAKRLTRANSVFGLLPARYKHRARLHPLVCSPSPTATRLSRHPIRGQPSFHGEFYVEAPGALPPGSTPGVDVWASWILISSAQTSVRL